MYNRSKAVRQIIVQQNGNVNLYRQSEPNTSSHWIEWVAQTANNSSIQEKYMGLYMLIHDTYVWYVCIYSVCVFKCERETGERERKRDNSPVKAPRIALTEALSFCTGSNQHLSRIHQNFEIQVKSRSPSYRTGQSGTLGASRVVLKVKEVFKCLSLPAEAKTQSTLYSARFTEEHQSAVSFSSWLTTAPWMSGLCHSQLAPAQTLTLGWKASDLASNPQSLLPIPPASWFPEHQISSH